MPITLTVEDGTGLADSNSYVSLAEATAYHETNLYSADWPTDEEEQKKALITATRILDQQYDWAGYKKLTTQALQWPRVRVPDPDSVGTIVPPAFGYPVYLLDTVIPKPLKDAVLALALALIGSNPEVRPDSEGISSFSLSEVMSVSFDHASRPDVVPEWIQIGLAKYGKLIGAKSGFVKLIRA